MNTPLISFYQDVLGLASLHMDPKGYVRSNHGEKSIITVETRLLVLPTRDHMRSLTPDKEVFHPLAEDTLNRMSETLKTYAYRLNGSLNTRFVETMYELQTFCNSPKKQLGVTPAQLAIIRNVQGTVEAKDTGHDDTVLRFLTGELVKQPSSAFINVTLARGTTFKGQKRSRVGFVTFPLYKRIKDDLLKPRKESEFDGMNKKNLEMVLQLYEAIFPGLDIPEEYGYGFDTGLAPWFTTLLQTAAGVADRLNVVLEAFEEVFESDDLKPLNLNWQPLFEKQPELQRLARMAQNTEVNPVLEGKPEVSAPKQVVSSVATPSVPFMGGSVAQTTYVPPASAPTTFARPASQQTGRDRVSFDEWKSKSATPSPLATQGNVIEAIRRYNEGYAAFYNTHIQTYGVPPGNMPNPAMIPAHVPAPPYPGAPQLPMIPGLTAPMQPQGYGQQPALNAWGQPIQPMQGGFNMQPAGPAPGSWVQTPQGMMQVPMGQPQQFAQQGAAQAAWGQTWGQPQQLPQAQNWGQQGGFNQPVSTHSGQIYPGVL